MSKADEERFKLNFKLIDELIEILKGLKNNAKNFSINVIPDLVNEIKLVDGTMYAQREININIIFDTLFTKNENDIWDHWKPYKS